ncbi:DUF885 family protein [Sphingomonas nostoxanthinifaciens]|uniref:DUF885 family protein n=1 Tax=Sphingomonas nostoxanthinifaciens TaxID=2872652 RepID=UPI001CC1D1AE|nr:DUF885 family protein [Sphingomonas nostoxanthinifaciens]UAK24565.1 DUF885 domain-containing protein [Sphingomonas nostoxanthinifaciens]
MARLGFARTMKLALAASLLAPAAAQALVAPGSVGNPALQALFVDWRKLAAPTLTSNVADFGPAALAQKTTGLVALRARLAGLDRAGWTDTDRIDAQLIEAEMNGFDFDLRVRKPWAQDPDYYVTVFGEESDVPAHEGPSAGHVDLFAYKYPLSAADAHALAQQLAGVPVLLARAKQTLAAGNGADLWHYGARAFKEQADVLAGLIAGTLDMRTHDGHLKATLAGTGPDVRKAAEAARTATADFATWIAAEAPKKTGPSGVGKDNYDWYMKHVQLVPYSWDEQVALLKRELERAWAGLALEEAHNRALPPLDPIDDKARYDAFAIARMKRYTDFVMAQGFEPDRPYYRAALAAQTNVYAPLAERNFFLHVTARDPVPLYAHDIHWIELARIRLEPNADPIRAGAPLFNIYAARSEGFATAFEEVTMEAGLYDDEPRGRELVWTMLANRAARGLASLYVQANMIDLAHAGHFHASWTPRGWSDPANPLVGFEQLLYLRQPGYGSSYVTGKLLLDRLIARQKHAAERAGLPFDVRKTFADINAVGILPWPLIEQATTAPEPDPIPQP